MIAWLDTGIYWLLAVSTLIAGTLIFYLPTVTVRRPRGRGWTQLLEGIRYVYKNPLVLPAITLDLFIVLVGSVVALLPRVRC